MRRFASRLPAVAPCPQRSARSRRPPPSPRGEAGGHLERAGARATASTGSVAPGTADVTAGAPRPADAD